MALASGVKMFTPPKAVAMFERRNMLLPLVYAGEGDAILTMYEPDPEAVADLSRRRPDIRLLRLSDLRGSDESFSPWGWNLSLRTMLARAGYPDASMPSDRAIACWRDLAHRRTALRLNRLIGVDERMMPREFTDRTEAERYVAERGNVMLKMPWSSSGRGVLAIMYGEESKASRRISDSIASQGSILVEPLHDRVCDFATEWESDGTELRFCGFSMFETDSAGRYKGNVIAPQQEITDRLSAYAPADRIKKVPELLASALERLLLKTPETPYIGLFGVDGLIDREGDVVACIEINLRRTMGHVALAAQAAGESSKLLCAL